MDEFFKTWVYAIAIGTELAAGAIIALGALAATWRAIRVFVWGHGGSQETTLIRLNFGRWLVLALEFELAADILRTTIAPTWSEIGQLAAIVVIRTVLTYSLQREIEKVARAEQALAQHDEQPGPSGRQAA